MATTAQLRSVRSHAVMQSAGPATELPVPYHLFGRLIQITLALYLLPALLAVLMVGGVGILVLKIDRIYKSQA
jgi:hypothetical protein